MERWSGKVCVVTGASAGIGANLAETLVKHGCIVVGLARRVEKIEEQAKSLTAEKGKLYGKKCDITKEDEVESCFKWIQDTLGPIHVLINNAGMAKSDTICEGDPKAWKQTLDLNVYGLALCSHFAIKQMREYKIDGHIVNISSVVGHQVIKMPLPTFNMYAPSKFAVTALEKVLEQELAYYGTKIKVSNVSPGLVWPTEYLPSGNFHVPEEVLESLPSIRPENVTEAVIFVLSTPPHVQVQDIVIKAVGEIF